MLAQLLLTPHGMMFQSYAVTSQWDTWAFVENSTYYAYYLVTEHSPGEGFGVATSPDGQHWTDHGYVFHGPSWTEHHWWQGTGSVWRAPDYNRTGRCVHSSARHGHVLRARPSRKGAGSWSRAVTGLTGIECLNLKLR